ncbi:unnamed protein product [Caenorhabditis sp. 36 PRJEB53466]|nr:unnamed protein product [Caenorhabditis sp. 36 PRJEB53466]
MMSDYNAKVFPKMIEPPNWSPATANPFFKVEADPGHYGGGSYSYQLPNFSQYSPNRNYYGHAIKVEPETYDTYGGYPSHPAQHAYVDQAAQWLNTYSSLAEVPRNLKLVKVEPVDTYAQVPHKLDPIMPHDGWNGYGYLPPAANQNKKGVRYQTKTRAKQIKTEDGAPRPMKVENAPLDPYVLQSEWDQKHWTPVTTQSQSAVRANTQIKNWAKQLKTDDVAPLPMMNAMFSSGPLVLHDDSDGKWAPAVRKIENTVPSQAQIKNWTKHNKTEPIPPIIPKISSTPSSSGRSSPIAAVRTRGGKNTKAYRKKISKEEKAHLVVFLTDEVLRMPLKAALAHVKAAQASVVGGHRAEDYQIQNAYHSEKKKRRGG